MTVIMPVAAILLAACTGSHHARMQQELAALQAMNQADSLLTNDSLAQALADWFDDHGTPNEQMEAHYLLGRTHADRGEAPAALAAYHDAIDRADTTSADCNYRQLCRVYSQMADVFYKQNLLDNQMESLDKSISYALKAGDTLQALNAYGHKMVCYGKQNMTDSVIALSRRIYRQYMLIGYPNIGAQYYGFAIKRYLAKGEYEEARKCIDIYESCSGYFDENRNIAKGREAYYNSKGNFYLSTHQYDSAHYYFRKELRDGKDYNNQNMGAMGLARFFIETGQPDSAAKYSLYAYSMNDSTYAEMSTQNVANVNGLYNYSRHKEIADKERTRAEREERKSKIQICIIAVFTLVFFVLLRLWLNYKSKQVKKQMELARLLSSAQMDLLKARTVADELKTESQELKSLIQYKEDEMKRIRTEIEKKQRKVSNVIKEKKMVESDTFLKLQKKIDMGKLLTDHDWEQLNIMVINNLPDFHNFISSNKYALTKHEYEACMLFRLHVKPLSISVLMGVSPSLVTRISKTLLMKLFSENGDKNDLIAWLEQYG